MRKLFLYLGLLLLLVAAVQAVTLPPGVQKYIGDQKNIALGITFLAAFLAGVVSFTSPCGFVLLPMFFSYAFQERKKALAMTSFFSLGLLVSFTLFGVIAGLVGNFFNAYKQGFALVGGLVIAAFGVMLFFNKGFSLFRVHVDPGKKSAFNVFSLGVLFAVGWTPCVGTILGGIVLLAGISGSLLKAALLLVFFGLGVALPLVFLSYFSDRVGLAARVQGRPRELNVFGRKVVTSVYNIVGAVLLVTIGLLTAFFKGTQFFQVYIPELVPWSMGLWGEMNERFAAGFYGSPVANVLGVLLGLVLLSVLVLVARRSLKQ